MTFTAVSDIFTNTTITSKKHCCQQLLNHIAKNWRSHSKNSFTACGNFLQGPGRIHQAPQVLPSGTHLPAETLPTGQPCQRRLHPPTSTLLITSSSKSPRSSTFELNFDFMHLILGSAASKLNYPGATRKRVTQVMPNTRARSAFVITEKTRRTDCLEVFWTVMQTIT